MLKRLCLFAVILMAFSSILRAEKIGKIMIESVNNEVNLETLDAILMNTISSRVGMEYDMARESEDIKKLIKSGKLDEVRTRISKLDNGDIELTFILKAKPVVKTIKVRGATEYKEAKLLKLCTQEIGSIPDDKLIAADRKAILTKYRDAGYYGTQVNSIKEPNESGTGIDLIYIIKEEKRCKLQKVRFENNTVFDEDTLRKSIVTKRQWWRYIFRFGNYFNADQLFLDKDALSRLYGTKGYMDFTVKEIRQEMVDEDSWVIVTFVLDEGQPYTVGNITLQGAKKFTAEELLGKTSTQKGDIHSTTREEVDLSLMKAEYEVLGYLDLKMVPNYKKDTEKHIVDIQYLVSEGRPSTIRNIEITGNTITKDEVIRRELAIAPGDLGDAGKIRTSKNRLNNMGYFETVDILHVDTEQPDFKDLRIELKEKPTGQLSIGAGYSTDEDGIGFIEFSENNFDLMRLLGMEWPPKGDGQRLRARTQIGSSSSSITISHIEPWFLDRRLELETDLFLNNRYEDEYDQRNIGVAQTISWPVAFMIPGTEHVENWRLGVGYRLESIKISDVDEHSESQALKKGDFVNKALIDEEGRDTVPRLIVRMNRDTRNTFLFPTEGSLATLESQFVTSDETYARFELSGSKYIPLHKRLTLKLNASYYTNSSDDAPIYDRYFAGGIGTIRGYKRRDVAPIDRFDDPFGGNSMFTGTVELLTPVKDFMYFSVFFDGGNSWWDNFNLELGDLNYTIGCGVQLKVIPISLFYGYPIRNASDHLDGKSGRLHFNMGFTF